MRSTSLIEPIALTRPWRTALVFVLLLTITYFEPLSIGGLKFSVLWRAAFVVPAAALIVMRPWPQGPLLDALRPLAMAWIVLTIAPVLSASFGATPVGAAGELLAQRLLPPMVVLLVMSTAAWATAESVMRALPLFLVAVSPLFFLGVLKPLGVQFELDAMGLDAEAYTGVFQNQHSAAFAHTVAGLAALTVFAWEPSRRSVIYLVASIGCLALVAATTARAGLGAYVAGLVVIAWIRRDWRLVVWPAAAAVLGITLLGLARPEILEFAVDRMLGRSQYTVSTSLDSFTSGRLGLQKAALDAWVGLDTQYKVFGIGNEAVVRAVGLRTGFTLFAHNAFIDELLDNGLLGLVALLATFVCAVRLSWANARMGYPLGLALTVAMAAFGVFQGLNYSLQVSFIALAIALETAARLRASGEDSPVPATIRRRRASRAAPPRSHSSASGSRP